jgi:hypothetical protein
LITDKNFNKAHIEFFEFAQKEKQLVCKIDDVDYDITAGIEDIAEADDFVKLYKMEQKIHENIQEIARKTGKRFKEILVNTKYVTDTLKEKINQEALEE